MTRKVKRRRETEREREREIETVKKEIKGKRERNGWEEE